MRPKQEQDSTGNSSIYRKLHKKRFASCFFCPWHGGENQGRRARTSSWKRSRKAKQYQ